MPRRRAASDVFHALADPSRRLILDLLLVGRELPVHDLAMRLPISQPAVSQHLAVLRAVGLVHERRVGRERRYVLDPGPLARVAGWLHPHLGDLAALLGTGPRTATTRAGRGPK